MRFNQIVIVAITFFILLLTGCWKGKEQRSNKVAQQPIDLIELNKSKVSSESKRIEKFIANKNWKMQSTGTGLRYMIYHKVDSSLPKAKVDQLATVRYKIYLLNDKLCYETDRDKPESFMIGKDYVETGLHEGVQYMRKGEKARFIMPPHLAHGLVGDMDKIPGDATIVYDVELLELK